ncbi:MULTISPECIES: hypothetical protein [unclassified Thiomonas]|jgi:hypothetical protein|uniref:hypothetical protein n=1 Tax=unclassified Thiomonas TaxID=2625466 RepID=UPI00257B2F83|nr:MULTISPECIES: hypothetical protein [unclassified Thiomonas]
MPSLSSLEIRRRLSAFVKQWQGAHSEAADAKLFWAKLYESAATKGKKTKA